MVVRRVDVDVEVLEINLADSETFAAEPVAVKDAMRVAVHAELVEGGIVDLYRYTEPKTRVSLAPCFTSA